MAIPVYAFTGFLDAGKTKFIQETLEDERFNAGERTLLLICEEGEEEYDLSVYPYQHVYPEVIDQEAVTTEELSQLFKKHHCERVVVELNGMLQVGPFYQKMPEDWQIAQEVMFADGTSMMTTVMPSFLLMSPISSRIWRVVLGSSALVASSQSRTLGFVARARAMATRCCCPPESCAG